MVKWQKRDTDSLDISLNINKLIRMYDNLEDSLNKKIGFSFKKSITWEVESSVTRNCI